MKRETKTSLQKELARKEKQLSVLFQVIRDVSSLELKEVLQDIVDIVSKISKADSCLVYLLDKENKELILRASKKPHRNLLKRIKMKMGEGITGWVAKEKKPVVISQKAFKDKRFKYFKSLPEDRYQAFLSIPIINKIGVVGVINIQHKKPRKYDKEIVELLTNIGRIVGGAVENARLVEESLELREALQTRKFLDRAKGILMKKLNIPEDKAYEKIRIQSMNSGKTLKEVSEAIILSDKLMS